MLMLKVCHTCECVLGELELEEALTDQTPAGNGEAALCSDLEIIGNVVYTVCPDCLDQMEFAPSATVH
ncbi:MAG: hypothetical protein LBT22_06210 [Peptococcaceae bacterium]|jgi:hypothetical protein|nr:hypothetical protein [Peptococcaceae bacterium]